jgi:hypothetical protein
MSRPWYREPWPWILIAPPAAAVVAGAITVWIAVGTADGLVADDYYRQGLAINQVLALEENARRLGVHARAEVRQGHLRVALSGASPEAVFAQLAHATRAGHDQRLRLARAAPGVYEAELPPLAAGRWRVVLEDPRREWRVVQEGL